MSPQGPQFTERRQHERRALDQHIEEDVARMDAVLSHLETLEEKLLMQENTIIEIKSAIDNDVVILPKRALVPAAIANLLLVVMVIVLANN